MGWGEEGRGVGVMEEEGTVGGRGLFTTNVNPSGFPALPYVLSSFCSLQDFMLQPKMEPGMEDEAAAGPSFLPEWPPVGSLGSGPLIGSAGAHHMLMGMGISPMTMGTSPFGKSLDMVDMCSQLMQAGKNHFSRTVVELWLPALMDGISSLFRTLKAVLSPRCC